MVQYTISFAGAGRVADALCREFCSSGHRIDLVVSESDKNGPSLADSCRAQWSDKLKYSTETDVIIVAVPDHKLVAILSALESGPQTLVAHTAGSIGLDVFPDRFKRKGVIYPLQTFSLGRKVDFADLPFFLESSDNESGKILADLVLSLGGLVYEADSALRRMVHLAAVFGNNFVNHMLTSAKTIASEAGFSFDVLRPLIEETFAKAFAYGPDDAQTGPAVRNDLNTIGKHMEILSFDPALKRLYDEVTLSIINFHKKL